MAIDPSSYRDWIQRFDTLDASEMEKAARFAARMIAAPTIDVAMPVFNTPEQFLLESIESVRRQIYPQWSLSIFDDCSTEPHVRRVLDGVVAAESRIRVARGNENRGIAAATNAAIAMGRGPFVLVLDHDDVLAPHALLLMAECVERHPDVNVVHGDLDILDERGLRANPFFKPDYDPVLLLAYNIVRGAMRRTLLEEIGGLREGFAGSEDYDLSLRVVERSSQQTVRHVPHVVYHWRMVPSSFSHTKLSVAVDSSQRAVREHCSRLGMNAHVAPAEGMLAVNRTRPEVNAALRVTLAVEGGTPETRETSTKRLVARTTSPPSEVTRIARIEGETPGAFRNRIVRRASTPLVAFTDVRLSPRNGDWLERMASQFAHARCAAVGARVIFPAGTIEQCGVLLGVREHADSRVAIARAQHGAPEGDMGYHGRGRLAHGSAALAGTALVVRSSALLSLGGFDEILAESAAVDVDFSLRAREAGLMLITCPEATFDASEPASWFESPACHARLLERWRGRLGEDPFYNPNLSDVGTDFGLAFPPRVRLPWSS